MSVHDDQPTAGFRNAEWTMADMPENTSVVVTALRTQDKAASTGLLYVRGKPKTVVCFMHPREFLATHYLIPAVLESGCAAFTQTPRSVGNDLRLEHETALLDVAAGMTWLRQQGFEKIILLGNSGGASLYSFYNQQALLSPDKRLQTTPAGRKTHLTDLTMPDIDGFVFVSPHPGQGKLLQACIDPSVTDEADPLSVDPTLDPLNPANGFKEPPTSSAYDDLFAARYRAAQQDRIARLDGIARDLLAERQAAKQKLKETGDRAYAAKAAFTPVITVWRTDADLRSFDLSRDPSDRIYGSLWGRDPVKSNHGCVGFGRFCTPESWLSTWSGISSRAYMEATCPSIEQRTLFIEYTGDNAAFPSDLDRIYNAIGTKQKTRSKVRGNHHGLAVVKGETPGRDIAGNMITEWLREVFVN
jgi:hypothetical protein